MIQNAALASVEQQLSDIAAQAVTYLTATPVWTVVQQESSQTTESALLAIVTVRLVQMLGTQTVKVAMMGSSSKEALETTHAVLVSLGIRRNALHVQQTACNVLENYLQNVKTVMMDTNGTQQIV